MKLPAVDLPLLPLPPPPLVRDALRLALAAPEFANAKAHQRLLGYLVEHLLAGDTGRLKEPVLAIEVFQRRAATFDPAQDSIVRVEARRLRQRLARYYLGSGAPQAVRFQLPPGQYVLHAEHTEHAEHAEHAGGVLSAAAPSAVGDAQELAERGEFFLRLGHEEGLHKALDRFGQSARLAPGVARGYLGCARALTGLVGMTYVAPMPAVSQAIEHAEKALEIDPEQADALALLAGLRHRFALDWAGAQQLYARARRATAPTAFLHHQIAFSLMFVRRFDEAASELQIARTLDPLNNSVRAHEALLALYRRDYTGAESHLRALLDLQPQALAVSLLGYVHLQRGEAEAALACYRQAEMLFPQLTIGPIGVAQAQALLGQAAQARATVERLRVSRGALYLPPYQLALVSARLGEAASALALLEQAQQERDSNFVCLPVDPGLDTLRSEPRFVALERLCGLPD